MSLRNLGQFNSADISALLSAATAPGAQGNGGNPSSVASLLLAHGQNRIPAAPAPGYGSLGLSSSSIHNNNVASQRSADYQSQTSALLSALLQHQQREDQKKAALLQQLNSALASGPSSNADSITMLMQHKQLTGLPQGNSGNPLSFLGGGISGLSQNSEHFRGPTHGGQLDAIAISKILQSQQQQAAVASASQEPAPPPPAPTSSSEVMPSPQATVSAQLNDAATTASNSSATVTPAYLETPFPSGVPGGASVASSVGDRRRKGRTGTFPQKLHQMLSDLEREEGGVDIASFLPHGRAFAIHKPRDFVKHVMPKYFRMSRFSSFQRQLNLYDFQRITEGPDKGSYYHELFVQGRPILSTMMKRNKIKGVKNLKPNNSPDEDDVPAEDDDMQQANEDDNKTAHDNEDREEDEDAE